MMIVDDDVPDDDVPDDDGDDGDDGDGDGNGDGDGGGEGRGCGGGGGTTTNAHQSFLDWMMFLGVFCAETGDIFKYSLWMESLASQLVRQTGDMAVPITSSRSVRLPSDDGNIPVAAVLDFQRHQPFRVVKCKQHPLVILYSAKLMFKSILRRVVFEF